MFLHHNRQLAVKLVNSFLALLFFTLTLQLYGKKVDNSKIQELIDTFTGIGQFVLPTLVTAILDIVPWLWYIPSNVSNALFNLSDRNIKWFTAEIEERRVSSILSDTSVLLS